MIIYQIYKKMSGENGPSARRVPLRKWKHNPYFPAICEVCNQPDCALLFLTRTSSGILKVTFRNGVLSGKISPSFDMQSVRAEEIVRHTDIIQVYTDDMSEVISYSTMFYVPLERNPAHLIQIGDPSATYIASWLLAITLKQQCNSVLEG